MSKKIDIGKKMAIGAAIATALVGIAVSPAVAGNQIYCSGSWVCVYKNSYFDVPLGYRTAGFSLQNISAANDNEVSSWENKTSTNARWYTGSNGSGTCHTMAKFSELGYMNPFTQNDQMSSWAGNGGC